MVDQEFFRHTEESRYDGLFPARIKDAHKYDSPEKSQPLFHAFFLDQKRKGAWKAFVRVSVIETQEYGERFRLFGQKVLTHRLWLMPLHYNTLQPSADIHCTARYALNDGVLEYLGDGRELVFPNSTGHLSHLVKGILVDTASDRTRPDATA